jgi:hypothetical protein
VSADHAPLATRGESDGPQFVSDVPKVDIGTGLVQRGTSSVGACCDRHNFGAVEDDVTVARVTGLIGAADRLIGQALQGDFGWYVSAEGYAGWRAQSLAAITAIVGEDNIYYTEFQEGVNSTDRDQVQRGRGILTALRDDITNGHLSSIRDLVTADVFAGFLQVAGYLLENKYKDAAASITGAVLENGLRDVLAKHDGKVAGRGNLQSLSQQMLQKKLVSGLELKNPQAWIALRDHADHGEFKEYDVGDVKRMIDGVTDFLSKHLG